MAIACFSLPANWPEVCDCRQLARMGHRDLIVADLDPLDGKGLGIKWIKPGFQNNFLHSPLTGSGQLRLRGFARTRGHDTDVAGIDLNHFYHANFVGVGIEPVSAGQQHFALDAAFTGAGEKFARGKFLAELGDHHAEFAARHDDLVLAIAARTGTGLTK